MEAQPMTVRIQTLFETPANERMSAQEYLDSPQSEQKSDLIEGVFVMASPASYRHEQFVTLMLTTLDIFVEAHDLGQVLSSNAAYMLSKDNVYQPDVSFVRTDRLHLAGEVRFAGPPDLAVEIISPSSRQYDTGEKRINYARFGTDEYWLIDPLRKQATVYERIGKEWIPLPQEEGILRSKVLDGYWLRLEWLFPTQGEKRITVLEIGRAQGIVQ